MKKRCKTDEFKRRHSLSSALIEKEKQWNINAIKKKKAFYANKYDLNNGNVYNRVFHFLNDKIRYEIEMNEKRKKYNRIRGNEFFCLKKYSSIYENNSKKLLKYINTKHSQSNNKLKENGQEILQKVKMLNIKRKSLPNNTSHYRIEPKVYNHDKDLKFKVKLDKLDRRLKTRMTALKNKLGPPDISALNELGSMYKSKELKRGKGFSKKAYLASLNYSFKDPFQM